MQAWDHCHTPEQVFQHCGTGKRGRKKSWLSQKQPDIFLQLLQIKAKGDKIQNKTFSWTAGNSVIFKAKVCSFVFCSVSPLSFHFLIFFLFLCSHREACSPGAAASQCIAPHTRGMHITHRHMPDDAQNFLPRNHYGGLKWTKRWEHRLSIEGGKVVVSLQNKSNIVVYSARWLHAKTNSCNQKKLGMNWGQRRWWGVWGGGGRLLRTPERKWKDNRMMLRLFEIKRRVASPVCFTSLLSCFPATGKCTAHPPQWLFADIVRTHTCARKQRIHYLPLRHSGELWRWVSRQELVWTALWFLPERQTIPLVEVCVSMCARGPCTHTLTQASFSTFEDQPSHIALYCIT